MGVTMNYLIYTAVAVLAVLFLFGMLVATEEKAQEPAPHDEPHAEHPELAPDIYAGALAYLLIDAELRGLVLAGKRYDDNEAGKGARV